MVCRIVTRTCIIYAHFAIVYKLHNYRKRIRWVHIAPRLYERTTQSFPSFARTFLYDAPKVSVFYPRTPVHTCSHLWCRHSVTFCTPCLHACPCCRKSMAPNCINRCVQYRVDEKVRPQSHSYNSVKSQPIFTIFFTRRFLGKFALKWLLKIPPLQMVEFLIKKVAILPSETLMPENKRLTITYKVV